MHTRPPCPRPVPLVAYLLILLLSIALGRDGWASCGSTFCSVNTSWDTQGLWTQPGTRLDVRFEFVDQDQPRSGTDDVALGAIHRHHDEVRTLNRNWLVTLDHAFDEHWGVALTLPIVSRDHDHIHHHHGEEIPEDWKFTEPGDLRVLGRYRFTPAPFAGHHTGVRFGLKLPTGDFSVTNDEGDEAERTLQPGTGTTDLLLGIFHAREFAGGRMQGFAQALWQQPLNERDDFEPGYQLFIDTGMRYGLGDRLAALLQLNLHFKGRDAGAAAEREDSGSRTLSISPGVSLALTPAIGIYAFVQVPLYRHVNGVQLTAEEAFTVGMMASF